MDFGFDPARFFRMQCISPGVLPHCSLPVCSRIPLSLVRNEWSRWRAPATLLLAVLAVLAGVGAGAARGAGADDLDFFEKKIRPVLVERCYECHSAEGKTKAGLRLDTPEGWKEGGDSGPAVIAGNVDQSPLIKAIRYSGLDFEAMPPKSALPAAEVALLEEWVRRGAPAPAGPVGAVRTKQVGLSLDAGRKFWAFIPPVDSPLPRSKMEKWARTDVDRFIAAKWTEKGLQPAADADRATFFRRVSFDLLGFPPAPEELAAFERDSRPDAREQLIDRLLSSRHFGERWGRQWLDVARFAESSGGGRTLLFKDAWRYRDYVIDAFNRDLPFDQFIREQIAGDLLPHASPDERARRLMATAFLALGPTNYEEQNKDALRMDIVDEQLDVIGKGFLGMTIGCARCHDHKFDPIPTQDYYALAGILRSTHTLHNYTDNVAKWVDVPLPADAEIQQQLAEHEAKVAELNGTIAKLRRASKAPAAAGKRVVPTELDGAVIDDAQALVVGNWKGSTFSGGYVGEGYLTDNNDGKGAKTVTFTPAIAQSGRYEVRLAYTALANRATNVPVTILHADGENVVVVNQREAPALGGRFHSLGKFRFEKEGQGYVLISNEGTDGYVVVDALQVVPADDGKESAALVAAATSDDPKVKSNAAELRRLEAELKKLTAGAPQRPLTMGVKEAVGEIGDTEIRIRGVARNLGAKVPRGFLQVAQQKPPQFRPDESGRRELAEWIASADNPLTARVIVNRIWAGLMGAGLVRTVDNFGTTGELPSHPELLDHLARRFVASGWSMKQLVRDIVLTRTYGLATTPNAEAAQADPDNRLLSHARRRRLDAEQIRDAILWAGGKLDLTFGGPNLAAPGVAMPTSEYGHVFTDTRRSVYTPAFRNRRLELFEVFDFADINAPIAQRSVTTVAPQALYLMNHPFVIEQAKAAAITTLQVAGDDGARIDHAYRRTLGRLPTRAERELSLRFVQSARAEGAVDAPTVEVWSQLQQSLFASVDFRYLN